jgi:alkanesulfonate monooxygenase SsuD/methylene tetrahydromethanopterin reductase-like flavin-dependent oxidoreductase (luciferase family)
MNLSEVIQMRIGIAPVFQNYADWPRYEAMLRGEKVPPPDDSWVMREQFSLCEMAEPLGFDSVWTYEHRSSPYILAPNPQQFAAYMAGRTRRINFGSMVTVMPWHNPVRLAENISLLQHMLGPNRRFYLGLGRGLARREYESLSIDQNDSRELFSEGIEVLKRALSGERVSFEGKVYKFDATMVRPAPLDTNTADELYGVWNSDASMEAAAQAGLHPLTVPSKSLEMFRKDFVKYDEVRAKYGHGPAHPPILQVFLYCSKSEQQAKEWAEQYSREYADSAVRSYEFGGEHFNSLRGYESYAPGQENRFAGPSDDARIEGPRRVSKLIQDDGLIGTPAQCIDQLAAINESMSPQEVVLCPSGGTMTFAESASSLQLFAEEALSTAKTFTSARVEALASS